MRLLKSQKFRLNTRSFLFLLLLLTSSVAAAVDTLRPVVHSTYPQASSFDFNCFTDKNAIATKNVQMYQTSIGLQISEDPTNQIITRIFAIFLKEKLHYQNVTLVPLRYIDDVNENDSIGALYQLSNVRDMAMISLALWMSPVAHRDIPEIYEAGASMSSGRYGWFVPKINTSNSTDENENLLFKIFLDHTNPQYKTFIIDQGVLGALRSDAEYFFKSPNCTYVECVTLLTGHRRQTGFIEKQISTTGSYVNVLYLGTHLKEKLRELYKSYHDNETYNGKRFIVLHWTPSDIINDWTEIKYKSILMPHCEDFETFLFSYCKYEYTPILKYFSKSLDTEANFKLMYALRKYYMNSKALENLQANFDIQLNNLSDDMKLTDSYNFVACNWLQNNTETYNTWIDKEQVIKLSIGGIFPVTDTSRGHQNLTRAVYSAENAINRNSNILNGYNITIIINDGQCKADLAMRAYIHYYNVQNVLGVLGPACSETVEPIAGISKHTNMAVISYSAEGGSFVDRQTYPYFFRTIGSNRQYEDVYINLMKKFGWKRVAALTEDGQKYTEYISHMEANMKQNNLELIMNKKFFSDVTAADMNKYLQDLKRRHAKIIIADIHNRNAELALCEAYKLGMTAQEGYVWFLPSWLSKNWSLLSQRSNDSCTSEQLQMAYEGHFTLMHTAFGNSSAKMQEDITIQKWLETYNTKNETISNYVGFAYDAVWAYALAADKLLHENRDAVNNLRSKAVVERFSELIWQTDFEGLSGRVRFGEGGSRISEIDIKQWRNSEFVLVGKFYPQVHGEGSNLRLNGGSLKLAEEDIKWLSDSKPPGDGTYDCGLSGLAAFLTTDCDTAAVVFTAFLCFLAVLVISLISFLFWKRRYDSKLKQSAKIMKTFGIDLLSPSRNKSNTLDKWEIPKENVVVNRRLGEGAFGTVYGGEAQLKSEGWTAVAVKTLKAGASTEDRLDFLSEAEAMKRLDHKNIIKLLGVCLQSEPIYTVMEFMLYGDLKTYLLARRHMVNDKTTDESDICPKRLTMYAMDVARGLAYLAQQKYVHRDLACRNCLVNAQRVVKIGDFGMARPTFESDYYRFNRKGMLPVRWMAPESLALGMFTPASDVWAFGVVVFEIITFGSFPFQGLTNNQVLEYVKSGKTLQIPVDVKPHLESLIKNCWNQETKKRPTAADIVDYISNHPRLLTPCLDYPGAAVEMPETESDEFELLPKARKCSPSKRDSTLDILAPTASLSNFERTRALIDKMELLDCNSVNVDIPASSDSRSSEPEPILTSIDPFSPITPDGYSVMSPLLMHQVSESSDSSQARIVSRTYPKEISQQTPF